MLFESQTPGVFAVALFGFARIRRYSWDMPLLDAPHFLPLIVLGLVAIWCGACLLLSLGGWSKLACDYTTDLIPVRYTHRWQSCRIGATRYGGCVHFGVIERGVFITAFWLFRPGHPPLFIPWTELLALDRNEAIGKSRFRCGSTSTVKVSLPTTVVDARRS
jgi:hypothetical protein